MSDQPANFIRFIPQWLSRDFIALHLRNYFNEQNLDVVRFDVRPASAEGENFASSMYRLNVTFTRQSENNNVANHSLIMKIPVSNETALAATSENNLYKKEMEFYGEIVPKINALLVQLDETKQLFANCYGVCSTNDALLLEDLATKSYGISSVYRGFDFNETKIVLKKLAAFHAINAVLQQQQPNIFENFKYGLMSRHTNANHKFYSTYFDAMTEAITGWPNASQYVPKLRRLRSKLLERGCKAFDPEPHHFNTLIHGDLWVNNIMTNYKTNRPNDVESEESELSIENMIFVDFQYACWTSPATDLQFFLNTSLHESLRPSRFEDLITYYHGNLETNLKRLGYKNSIPNLDQFKQQFRDKSFYGFITSCLTHPMLVNESTEKANLETLLSDDENAMKFKRTMFAAPKVQANLQKLLPMYDQMGTFD